MSLYLEHFGLREPPFRITPHTDFFFTGANRGPTLDALIYAITQDEGIVKVTGEVGSGKSMLCRMLLERLPDDVEALYMANPSLSRHEILGAIADELGIPADGKTTHSMIRTLQDALVERYAAGKRVVIMIDEAHAMPAESLEEIRLLSNLESKATKLLQIALFAQPELDELLAANDMRQLRERITQHFNLAPLKAGEVSSYIEFRLRAAGYHGPNPFTARAIELTAKLFEGLSRRINILADKALLAAYSAGSHQVDVAEVRIAGQDARFAPIQQKTAGCLNGAGKWLLAGTLVLAGAALAFVLWPRPSALTATAAPPCPGRNGTGRPAATDRARCRTANHDNARTKRRHAAARPAPGPLCRMAEKCQQRAFLHPADRPQRQPRRRYRALSGARRAGARTRTIARLSPGRRRQRPDRRDLWRLRDARRGLGGNAWLPRGTAPDASIPAPGERLTTMRPSPDGAGVAEAAPCARVRSQLLDC